MGQIVKNLPRSAWNTVIVHENNEQVIALHETDKLIFGGKLGAYPVYEYKIRKTVANMLYKVSEILPEKYKLVIIEGVRSLSKQKKQWDDKIDELKKLYPDLSKEEIEHKAGLESARPTPLANHNCGGAVDVALAHLDDTLVDMGTLPQSLTHEKEKLEMLSFFITEEQKHNRKILRDAMVEIGFVWYPGEWWHYCYGDRMWAVYLDKTECFYGPIESY